MVEFETSPRRAWKDTKDWVIGNNFKTWVIVGIILAVGTPMITAFLTPLHATRIVNGVCGFVGALLAILFAVLIVYIYHLFITPYRQRNETRNEVKKLTLERGMLNQEYTSKINEMRNRFKNPILLKAQEKHLEDVKAELERLPEHFLEVIFGFQSYFRDYPEQDFTMLKSHLHNNEFWCKVDSFKNLSSMYDSIYEELHKEIQCKAESDIASLGTDVYCITQHITPNFVKTVIEVSIEEDKFHRYEWISDRSWQNWAGNVISVGIMSENKHREFISVYSQDKRCKDIAIFITKLRDLRVEILFQIQCCITDNQHIHYLCARCPTAVQASQ